MPHAKSSTGRQPDLPSICPIDPDDRRELPLPTSGTVVPLVLIGMIETGEEHEDKAEEVGRIVKCTSRTPGDPLCGLIARESTRISPDNLVELPIMRA